MAKASLEEHIRARESDGGAESGGDGGSGDDKETENRHVFSFSFYEFLKHSVVTIRASLVAQLVKNPPAMQKTWV